MLPALDKMPREALLAGVTQERKGWPCCFLKWICGDGDLPLLPLSLHLWGFYTSPMLVWFFSLAEPQSRYQCPFQQFCRWSGFYPFFVWLCPSGSPTAFRQHKGFCRWLRENLRLGVWKLGRGRVLEPVELPLLSGVTSLIWSALNRGVGKPASFHVSQTDCLERRLRLWKWIENCSFHFHRYDHVQYLVFRSCRKAGILWDSCHVLPDFFNLSELSGNSLGL